MEKICKNCNEPFITKDYRQIFCGKVCSAKYNNTGRKLSEEQKSKISHTLKMKFKKGEMKNQSKGEKHAMLVGESTKGKYKKNPESILNLSSRTVSKIMKRLKIGCSICGWNESSCDVHHISGKKIPDPDNHKNLTYVCPNHHRMIHDNLIDKNTLKTLDKILPKNWKDYYYG